MIDSHTPKTSLPAELELALRNATWSALTALDSLRAAVEDHVHDKRSRGASQSEIDHSLRVMIEASGPLLNDKDYSAHRAGEIRNQVLKWSAGFYRR
jgi:hypothetical protein